MTERGSAVVRGITWTAVSQAIDIVVSFGAMLILVRVVPPAEYGRAAAVIGLLGLINIFGARTVVGHAIQLPEGETPDWQSHWSVALYLQIALALVCELVGWACWGMPHYRAIAPLVQIAGIGILLDGPNQIGAAMLRRQLDFPRLRLLATSATILKLLVTVVLAVLGGGAYALVVGGNVVTSLPYGVYLLVVRRWRPPLGWWRLPSPAEYRAATEFGLQQVATGIVAAASGAVEAAILPNAIGFSAMGLLGRARALYTTTAGRLSTVIIDAVYPFLPRASADRSRYARHATTFLQVILFLAIPAAVFLGLEGRHVSRLLYGRKWIAMDPLIWPGALSGLATSVFVVCAGILLAAGRLRASFLVQSTLTLFSAVALVIAWSTRGVLWYGWALTVAELCAAVVALWSVSPLLAPDWLQEAVYPPAVAAAIAAMTIVALRSALGPTTALLQMVSTTVVFACVAVVTCRIGFPTTFSTLLRLIPGQQIVPAWLAGDATGA